MDKLVRGLEERQVLGADGGSADGLVFAICLNLYLAERLIDWFNYTIWSRAVRSLIASLGGLRTWVRACGVEHGAAAKRGVSMPPSCGCVA